MDMSYDGNQTFDHYFDVDEMADEELPVYPRSFATYFEVSKKALVPHKSKIFWHFTLENFVWCFVS